MLLQPFVTALCTSAEPARQRQDHGCADGDLCRSVLREGMRHLRIREKETNALSAELLASERTQYPESLSLRAG